MSFAKCCFLLAVAAGALSVSIASRATTQAWPTQPSQLSVSTPYGHVQVSQSDYVYDARLMVDATTIEPEIKGLLNLPYAFNVGQSQSVLISIDTGMGDCPISFRWLTLKKEGYKLSDPFGSCTPKIRVSNQGATLIVHTPNSSRLDQVDEYRYDGHIIRQKRGKRLPIN